MTRLDIDPRFAAAHYQDGRDLKGDSVVGVGLPLSAVRTSGEVAPPIKFLGQLFVAKHQCGRAVYLSWDEPRDVHKVAREMGLTVEVLSQRAGDPFPEMVCAECRDGVCKQAAAAPPAQLGVVSVPSETLSGAQKQDHPECSGSTQPAAAPAYQPMTDEERLAIVREVSRGAAIRRDGNVSTRIVEATESAVLARVAAAPAAAPVAWRVRGYAAFKTGEPGPWRYVDGPARPKVNNPECCDFEPLYLAAPAAVQPVAQQQPSVHQVVGSGLPSQAVRTGEESGDA